MYIWVRKRLRYQEIITLAEFDEPCIAFIGTVTKDEISFDCEPYVEVSFDRWKDYTRTNINSWSLLSSEASFRSLLQSAGVDWKVVQKLIFIEKVN